MVLSKTDKLCIETINTELHCTIKNEIVTNLADVIVMKIEVKVSGNSNSSHRRFMGGSQPSQWIGQAFGYKASSNLSIVCVTSKYFVIFLSVERNLESIAIQTAASTSSVIRVSWEGNDEIEESLAGFYGYQVQYKLSTDGQFMVAVNVSHVYDVTMYSANVTGLSPNTVYTVRVAMYRQLGHLFDLSTYPSRNVNTTTLRVGELYFSSLKHSSLV